MFKLDANGNLVETNDGMDEEIDEENAFNEEEDKLYADAFGNEVEDDDSEEEDSGDLEGGISIFDIFQANIDKEKKKQYVEKNDTQPAALGLNKNKIKLSDLLDSLEDSETKEKMTSEVQSLLKTDKLVVPQGAQAAKREQEELAYKQQKKELKEWEPRIYKNRAKENLEFKQEEPPDEQNLASFKEKITISSSSLFSDLEKLTKQYEDKEYQEQELVEKHMQEEEAKKRFAKLQKMRYLLSYEEIKAKRTKKIKSKAYRRRQREKRKKFAVSIEELEAVDADAAEARRDKARKKRAQERFDLRHKGMNKWAQRQKKRDFVDDFTKKQLEEQHRLGQKLKQKMNTLKDEDEAEQLEEEVEIDENDLKEGIFELGFMKRAAEKREQTHLRLLEDAFLDEVSSDDEEEEQKGERKKVREVKFAPNSMRLVDAPRKVELSATVGKPVQFQVPSFGESAPTSFAEGFQKQQEAEKPKAKTIEPVKEVEEPEAKEVEVKLDTSPPKRKRKREESATSKANPWMQPSLKKKKVEKKAEMVFDPSKQLDVNFDENQFNLNGMNSEKQKQLIQKAFALGGEELEGFEKEKEKEIEASLPKAVNDNKYGWGSWAGPNKKRAPPSKAQQLRNERRRAEALNKRSDRDLKNVILNQTRSRKGAKYEVRRAPFPFESNEQYNKFVAGSIGTEWNTEKTFKKRTKPEISNEIGNIIKPMSKT